MMMMMMMAMVMMLLVVGKYPIKVYIIGRLVYHAATVPID